MVWISISDDIDHWISLLTARRWYGWVPNGYGMDLGMWILQSFCDVGLAVVGGDA